MLVLRCVIPRLFIYGTDGRLQQQIDISRDSVMASKEELDRFAAAARQQMGSAGFAPATIQEVLDGQLAAMRVEQRYRKAMQDRTSGLIAIWEQQPAELGDGPATVHWLSADGLYLGDTHFPMGWIDADLANGQLVVLAPDAATGVVQVIAFVLENAVRHAERTVPTLARKD